MVESTRRGEAVNPNAGTLPLSHCPTCGYEMDSATCTVDETRKARPGDLSCCLKCGELLMFDEALSMQLLDLNHMLKIPQKQQDELLRVQRVIRERRLLG